MNDLNAAHDHHHRGMREVDDLAYDLHAVYRLTERCRVIVETAKNGPPDGLSLVLVGDQADFEAAIELTTDFELMNSLPGRPSTPGRRSGDSPTCIARNGCRPVFSTLTEDEALAVGNELVNLLIRRFGHADAVALVEGRRFLDASGIAEDIERVLRNRRPTPLDQSLPLLRIRDDRPSTETPLEEPE